MSIEVLAWLKAEVSRLEGTHTVKAIETNIMSAAKTAYDTFAASVPSAVLTIATTLLTSAGTTPWATLVSTLISEAATIGHLLLKTEAAAVLNNVQNNLMATGTIAAPAAA